MFIYNYSNKIELFCAYIELVFVYALSIMDYIWLVFIILSLVKYNKDGVAGNKIEEVESSSIIEEKPLKKLLK